jgi:hypothetical protein
MNIRELLQTALNHREPGQLPVDFGATAVTGMHVTAVAALRKHFGLEQRPVKVHEPYQMLGWIDDDLKTALGIGVEGVFNPKTMFGFPNENWKPWRMPDGLEVLVSEHFKTITDAKGNILVYPEGDTSAPPSGRMPAGGYFFDAINRQPPLDEEKLDPQDNLEEFGRLKPADLAHFQKEVTRAAASGRGVISGLPGTAMGDIALVPAPFLKHPKGIRDVEEWYVSTLTRPDYIHRVFSRQTEIALENLAALKPILGDRVDAVFNCGTDFGTQISTFCSEETFRALYLPYYKKINDWIHWNTSWKTFKHSCGAVITLIPALIEAGFDILNPVQCSATGMDPAALKEKFGEQLVFWGGGVDTQKTLPFGTPAQVREEVLRRCEIFAPGGGFVFDAIHNVQARTPVENLVAMFKAVQEFNGG